MKYCPHPPPFQILGVDACKGLVLFASEPHARTVQPIMAVVLLDSYFFHREFAALARAAVLSMVG